MRYFFSVLLLSFFIVSCGQEENGTSEPETDVTQPPPALPGTDGVAETKVLIDETTGKPVLAEKPVNALSTMIGLSPKSKTDPIPPKYTAPQPQTAQEQRVVQVLTSNHWVVQTLIRINEKSANVQNQGAWFQFRPDGTYDYGFFTKKIGSGAWSFDGQNALLHLDSELLGDDREWSIKIGKEEDLMIWVGTERYTTTDIQMRLYNFIQIPRDRGEMGLEEKNGVLN